MRAPVSWCVALVLASAVLVADDHSVIFDEEVDFSTFKTFALRQARVTSDRPELNFPAVLRTLTEAARATLRAKGLKEVADTADLVVDCNVTGVDYSIGPFGRPNAIGARGGRGGRGAPVDFTEATIVLDISQREPENLLWRGVYHDTENEAVKLAAELPKDLTRLLAQFPPERKK